jgi:hypothetical protein
MFSLPGRLATISNLIVAGPECRHVGVGHELAAPGLRQADFDGGSLALAQLPGFRVLSFDFARGFGQFGLCGRWPVRCPVLHILKNFDHGPSIPRIPRRHQKERSAIFGEQ